MVIVLKRKKLKTVLCLFAACVFFCGVLNWCFGSKSAFLPSTGKTIIIDAGHAAHR